MLVVYRYSDSFYHCILVLHNQYKLRRCLPKVSSCGDHINKSYRGDNLFVKAIFIDLVKTKCAMTSSRTFVLPKYTCMPYDFIAVFNTFLKLNFHSTSVCTGRHSNLTAVYPWLNTNHSNKTYFNTNSYTPRD